MHLNSLNSTEWLTMIQFIWNRNHFSIVWRYFCVPHDEGQNSGTKWSRLSQLNRGWRRIMQMPLKKIDRERLATELVACNRRRIRMRRCCCCCSMLLMMTTVVKMTNAFRTETYFESNGKTISFFFFVAALLCLSQLHNSSPFFFSSFLFWQIFFNVSIKSHTFFSFACSAPLNIDFSWIPFVWQFLCVRRYLIRFFICLNFCCKFLHWVLLVRSWTHTHSVTYAWSSAKCRIGT